MFRLALITSILFAPFALADDKIKPDPAFSSLKDRWAKAAKDLGVPGFTVVVVRDGKVAMLETFGHADPAGQVPVTPDSAFYIASCTKTYTATAIMQLVDAGKIKLDQPVRTYLPQLTFKDDPKLAETITIRDLLCHRRGLDHDSITWAEAYTGQWNDELFWRLFPTTKIAGETTYSNLHYTLLGRVIQSVTGQHWRDYLAASVFKPAGMTHTTGYASEMYKWPGATTTLIRDGENRILASPVRKANSTMHAAGGLGTSPRDAATWMLLHLNDGEVNGVRILSPQSVAEMQNLQAQVPEGSNRPPIEGLSTKGFGLAWRVLDYRGHKILAHGGGYVGARANLSIMPDHNTGVFAMANLGDFSGALCELVAVDVYNRVLGVSDFNDPLPALVQQKQKAQGSRTRGEEADRRNKKPVSEQTLSRKPQEVAGEYANPDWGTIRVAINGGKTTFTWGELTAHPTTTGTDTFECHFERVTNTTGRFDENALVMSGVDEQQEIRFTKK